MTTHAKFSPSSRHRWSRCPGSLNHVEENRSSSSSIDGTHTHTLLSTHINTGLAPEMFIGQTLTDDDGTFLVDAERASRVRVAVDYLVKRRSELVNIESCFPCFVWSEQKVKFSDDAFGTADVVLSYDGVLEIIDYKDGVSPVSAEDNEQLQMYAVAHPMFKDCTTLRLTIIQPKLALFGKEPITFQEFEMTQERKDVMRSKLSQEIEWAKSNPGTYIPGEKQCQWCPGKGTCAAFANRTLDNLSIDLSQLNVAADASKMTPSEMTDEQICEIVTAAPALRQLIEAVSEEAKRRLLSGQVIQGLKLVKGRGSREWKFSEEGTLKKLKSMGVPKSALYTTEFVSPAKAEKLRWKDKEGNDKCLTPEQLSRLNNDLITKKDGAPLVAAEADERKPFSTSVDHLFSAV